jgi:hypothetical protein
MLVAGILLGILAGADMPNLPPGTTIPGAVTDPNKFPQWGLRTSDGKIVEAKNNAEKVSDITQGYVTWFTSRQAASGFNATQHGFASGQVPGISGLAAIGDFFARLTEASTWIRVGEFVAGALILYIGLKAIVAPEGQRVASRTAKQTVRKIAEKATPAGRAEHVARRTVGRKK